MDCNPTNLIDRKVRALRFCARYFYYYGAGSSYTLECVGNSDNTLPLPTYGNWVTMTYNLESTCTNTVKYFSYFNGACLPYDNTSILLNYPRYKEYPGNKACSGNLVKTFNLSIDSCDRVVVQEDKLSNNRYFRSILLLNTSRIVNSKFGSILFFYLFFLF